MTDGEKIIDILDSEITNPEGVAPDAATDDLTRALVDLLNQEDGKEGRTSRDLSRALGISHIKVVELLRDLDELGKLEVVQVRRRNLAGFMAPRPGYRIKKFP